MKLLFSSLMVACIHTAAGCDLLAFVKQVAPLAADLAEPIKVCLDGLKPLLPPDKLDGPSIIGAFKKSFCEPTQGCGILADAFIKLKKDFPTCDLINQASLLLGVPPKEGGDMLNTLIQGKAEACAITCANDDLACWTCAGAGVARGLNKDLDFCSKIPFCAQSTAGACTKTAVKCPGSSSVHKSADLIKGNIQAVAKECGKLDTVLATCGAACKTAVMDMDATIRLTATKFKDTSLLCLLDAAKDLKVFASSNLASTVTLDDFLPTFSGTDNRRAQWKAWYKTCEATPAEQVPVDAAQSLKLEGAQVADVAASPKNAASTAAPGVVAVVLAFATLLA